MLHLLLSFTDEKNLPLNPCNAVLRGQSSDFLLLEMNGKYFVVFFLLYKTALHLLHLVILTVHYYSDK